MTLSTRGSRQVRPEEPATRAVMATADMPGRSGSRTSALSTSTLCDDFRLAMRRLATTVSIVTTSSEGRPFGMTATAVTSLSTEPPSLLFCVNRNTSIFPRLGPGVGACVNLLCSEQARRKYLQARSRRRSASHSENGGMAKMGCPFWPTRKQICRARLTRYSITQPMPSSSARSISFAFRVRYVL